MGKIQNILEIRLLEFEKFHLSIWNVILIITILIGVKISFWLIKRILKRKLLNKGKVDDGRFLSILQLIQYFIYIIAIFISIESIGIDITLLIGAGAALLVGIGMGMQQTFNDIISGIIILFEGTIEVGDVVEIDSLVGTIKEIRLRTCKVETRESIIMIIPNSKFVTSNVINWSHNRDTTCFNISVGVAYGSDVDLVKTILIQCAKEHGDVLSTDQPFVRFTNFGESSLDFKLFFWTDKIWQVETIKSDLRFLINKNFRVNNITIPFPQRDIHTIKDL